MNLLTNKKAAVLLTSVLILVMLAGMFLPTCKRLAVPPPAQAELKGKAAALIVAMAEGRYEDVTKEFDINMTAAVPVSGLKDLWEEIVGQVGQWLSIASTTIGEEQGYHAVYVDSLFEKGFLDIKIVFDDHSNVVGLWLGSFESTEYEPPHYAKEEMFVEREVVIGEGRWTLPGVLSIPKEATNDAPVPAVVLVHGSGPNDKDETIGPNKPFKDLAWGLASNGIAVLRYDKRTRVYAAEFAPGTDAFAGFTAKEETIDDAVEAVRFLKDEKGIDADNLFVLGHSLGAIMGPRIAVACDDKDADSQKPMAGIVMMAAGSGHLADLMEEQIEYLAGIGDFMDEDEQARIDEIKGVVERIKSGRLAEGELAFGLPKSYWDDLDAYNQVETAKSLDLPVLILQGERDYQVGIGEFEVWKEELGGKPNVNLVSYPGLNHLFMSGSGKSTPNEYSIPSNVAEEVVKNIADWIGVNAGAEK